MMIPSRAAAFDIPTGLGADTPADFADMKGGTKPPAKRSVTDFPSWCSWMPFADYMDACRVPSQAEIDAETHAAIVKGATNPTTGVTNQTLVDQQYGAYQSDIAALCATDPEGCAAFHLANSSPTCSKLLGTGDLGQTLCGAGGGGMLLLAAGAAVLLVLISTRR